MAVRKAGELTSVLPKFVHLNDLACESSGGKVIFATDDWFAPAENLLKRTAPQFIVDAFTEFGKWMDGWETRRKRSAGHDWCIIQLGVPGIIHGFDIDTSYFTGNYAPRISVQAACLNQEKVRNVLPRGERMGTAASDEEMEAIEKLMSDSWIELVPMSKLQPGYTDTCHNYFPVTAQRRWTHIRLNLYPDGGIARMKVYGVGKKDWSSLSLNELVDLASMQNGGVCVGYSDAHFGQPQNLIGIGRAKNMGDGWETARRLDRPPVLKVNDKGILDVPGYEWSIFRLGHSGVIVHVEVDTNHFKGNAPAFCKIDATYLTPEEEVIQKNWTKNLHVAWKTILPDTKLKPHKRHFFDYSLIESHEIFTHVRLIIAPDGGVSRMRLWGFPRNVVLKTESTADFKNTD
ncbi:probable allantoicase [Protopterus annectens]|uniref:probable allantoicase n=1 Tax=Protopterus annectens TaxID=7888 RepID=UPI001CF99348|nr:probable allantoicase [Protopterus annectens]XP_043926425.1 probable allantoicase [Protopterus annectens]XP_043926433.1 probable allantoicase [Protopterus annectens]